MCPSSPSMSCSSCALRGCRGSQGGAYCSGACAGSPCPSDPAAGGSERGFQAGVSCVLVYSFCSRLWFYLVSCDLQSCQGRACWLMSLYFVSGGEMRASSSICWISAPLLSGDRWFEGAVVVAFWASNAPSRYYEAGYCLVELLEAWGGVGLASLCPP